MRALMWFRNDLRVRDNTALHRACRDADEGVVGAFAISQEQCREHDWGAAKADFVLRSVKALGGELARLNIPLRVVKAGRFSQTGKALLRTAETCGCESLYFNREYEVNEGRRDGEVERVFRKHGRRVQSFVDQVILDVSEMRTGTGGWYRVFTPFCRKWREMLTEGGPPTVWPQPRKQRKIEVGAEEGAGSIKGFSGRAFSEFWPAGEGEAGRRLKAFASKRIGLYHERRDFPDVDGTSELSPYLAAGVLSPRQCLQAALKAGGGRLDSCCEGVEVWINELIWREFYRHVLIGFPHVGMGRAFKRETEGLAWRYDEGEFEAWREGRTGYPIVDAGMRQLARTGWMHNRLRMIVAMFLTKDLFMDWRLGERHFMRNLVDGDMASNNGGWQWSASTGVDAAPYFRVFNPYNQSRRYDPEGDFIRRYVPELESLDEKEIHCPSEKARAKTGYPRPIVDRRGTREFVTRAFREL